MSAIAALAVSSSRGSRSGLFEIRLRLATTSIFQHDPHHASSSLAQHEADPGDIDASLASGPRSAQHILGQAANGGSHALSRDQRTDSQSWDVLNTFNIWQRTHPDGTHRKEIQFGQSSKSIYQQRVIAIRFLKGYHAEVVRTKKFERWYLPNKLPAIHVEPPKNVDVTSFVEGRERAGGRTRDDKFALRKQEMAQVPIGSMLYGQVERRLDTVVFRACFAPSIYAARMAVTTGKVKLNGQTVSRGAGWRGLVFHGESV